MSYLDDKLKINKNSLKIAEKWEIFSTYIVEIRIRQKLSKTKFVVAQKFLMCYSICAKVVIHNKIGFKTQVGASKSGQRLE